MTSDTLLLITFLMAFFVFIGIKKPVIAFGLVVAIAPWQSLMVDIGLRVTLHILSMAGLISAMLVTPWGKWVNTFTNKIWWPLCVFLLWVLTNNLIQLPNFSESQIIGGIMRSPAYRSWVQFSSLLLSLLPILAAPMILSSKKDLILVFKYFLYSIIILALLGWFQLLSIYLFDYYPMPVGFVNKWLNGMMVNGSYGVPSDLGNSGIVYRIVSLGGEPRYLSQSLALALLLIQIFWMESIFKFELKSMLLFIFLFITLIGTYASSGLLLWIICASILIFYQIKNKYILSNTKREWIIISIIPSTCFMLILLLKNINLTGDSHFSYIFFRLINRGFVADFDKPVLDFLLNNNDRLWFGVGLGNIHLYASDYLNPYFRDFAVNTAFVADSGWLRLISETGVIGLVLLLWWYLNIWLQLKKLKSNFGMDKAFSILRPMLLIAIIGYLLRGTTFSANAFSIIAITMYPIIAFQNKKIKLL